MLDTDIEGLSPKDAAEYVLSFITTMKATEKQLAGVGEEVALWTRRVALATEKGMPDLAGQAQARLDGLAAKRASLESELAELRAKVVTLKEKLKRLRLRPEKAVDTDLLLAELEMLVGPKDALADTMKREEAAAKLDELKRRPS